MTKPQNSFDHECENPEAGVIIDDKNEASKPEIQDLNEVYTEDELAFMNLSMIIARKDDLKQVKSQLAERGIKCVIKQMFAEYKFKPAKDTAALFHKARFEDVFSIVAHNPDFVLGGGPVLVVSVTQYLRLNERSNRNQLSGEDFVNLKSWLNKVFPNEELVHWEFTNGEGKKEYFLQTGSRVSTLFMYYLLNHYGEKASFKNPLHQDQKKERWNKIG